MISPRSCQDLTKVFNLGIPYRVPLVEAKRTGLWYEQISYSPTIAERKESINYACSAIRQLVNQEKSRGIEHEKIIIGGFDMGGTIAMHVGYRYNLLRARSIDPILG